MFATTLPQIQLSAEAMLIHLLKRPSLRQLDHSTASERPATHPFVNIHGPSFLFTSSKSALLAPSPINVSGFLPPFQLAPSLLPLHVNTHDFLFYSRHPTLLPPQIPPSPDTTYSPLLPLRFTFRLPPPLCLLSFFARHRRPQLFLWRRCSPYHRHLSFAQPWRLFGTRTQRGRSLPRKTWPIFGHLIRKVCIIFFGSRRMRIATLNAQLRKRYGICGFPGSPSS